MANVGSPVAGEVLIGSHRRERGHGRGNPHALFELAPIVGVHEVRIAVGQGVCVIEEALFLLLGEAGVGGRRGVGAVVDSGDVLCRADESPVAVIGLGRVHPLDLVPLVHLPEALEVAVLIPGLLDPVHLLADFGIAVFPIPERLILLALFRGDVGIRRHGLSSGAEGLRSLIRKLIDLVADLIISTLSLGLGLGLEVGRRPLDKRADPGLRGADCPLNDPKLLPDLRGDALRPDGFPKDGLPVLEGRQV